MPHTHHAFRYAKLQLLPIMLLLLLFFLFFLVGCGGGASSSSAGSARVPINAPSHSSSSKNQQSSTNPGAAQYLVKTLTVSMGVRDTNKAADTLQTWITTTDPHSSSAGITYNQMGDNLYNVSLTFSVQSTLYPQIERYLKDYASQNGGQLLSLNETVQDVSNDYIDTQSRLTNLRGEQTRLLDLLSHAQALGDIISIQDKLTDVEGQIETIEAHLKQLNGQLSFYTVTIALQPLSTVLPSSPPASWNIGQTFHDAFTASLGFAQGLLTFLIWLLAYSFYIIPVAILTWFFFRWRRRSLVSSTLPTPSTPTVTPPVASV